MRAMVESLRKEVSDLIDQLEETEEDRRNARSSHRAVQWKLSKLKGKNVGDMPTELDYRADSPGKRALPEVLDLPDDSSADPAMLSHSNLTAGVPGPSHVIPLPLNKRSKEDKSKTSTRDISKQFKSLIRKRVELRRQGSKNSGTGNKQQRRKAKEKPLPQRVPLSQTQGGWERTTNSSKIR